MPNPKTPLLRALQRSAQAAASPQSETALHTRRAFLTTSAKAAAFIGISTLLPEPMYAGAIKPRVAIVGAGIAGLNAAHYLKTKNILATIYEAANRPGGRILTKKDGVSPGITSEIGAEFIDTGHCEMFALAKKFGLKLKNTSKDPLNNGPLKETFFIDGRQYTLKEVLDEFNLYKPQIEKDNRLQTADERHLEKLDHLSLSKYFDHLGMSGWFRKLMDNAYTSEFGIDVGEQSSLNFISMICGKPHTANDFYMYGESDEVYGIEGGNSMIIQKLAQYTNGQIRYAHRLNSIRSKGKGFVLSFDNGKEAIADFVIMTLPFTMLRSVDMRIDNMPPAKTKAINELGYGANTKLILGMNRRTWRTHHRTAGYLFNDHIQNGWDSSHMQGSNGGAGAYTIFTGAQRAIDMANMSGSQQALAAQYLPVLDNIFKGSKDAYNGNALVADWPNQEFIKASYAGYTVGQWSSIAGTEGAPVGNLLFAGEHCSEDWQGFMNGGAETGKAAARLLLKKLNLTLKTVC